jgi:hypothetical protein
MLKLFLIGLTSSFSTCMLFCSPLLCGYVGGTRTGWLSGIRASAIVLITRLLGFGILGGVAFILKKVLLDWFMESKNILSIGGSLFIILLGVIIIFGRSKVNIFCKIKERFKRISQPYDLILLGLLMAFIPCPPHLVLMSYIALTSPSFIWGMGAGMVFGIGTSFLPLVLATGMSQIPQIILKPGVLRGFRILCGIIVIAVGLQLLIPLFY